MASLLVKCRDGPMPHPSLAFQLKCERETEKLRTRLRVQLQNDMLNLLQEKTFADITFITGDRQQISALSSLLKVRAPRFYNHCLTTLDNCKTTQSRIVELPGLSGVQLHKLIRIIYCGEEVEEEETLILNLLYNCQVLKSLNSCDKINMENVKMNSKEMYEGDRVENILESSEECVSPDDFGNDVRHHSNGNEGNYEFDEYSSISEGINCNGTLTDLTDPFSISTSDVMNVSTLNANDDVSVVSTEDVIETLDAHETFQVENIDPMLIDVNPETPDPAKGANFETEEIADSSSPANMEIVTEPDSEKNLVEALESMTTQIAATFDGCDDSKNNLFPEKGPVEQGENSSHNDPKGIDEFLLMVRSNESKDGDSGVCCSLSRKLSTSSGRHSPCSEHLQDSPTGSLPKDDSLEFCPDSLANDDVDAMAACVDGPTGMEWNLNAAYQLDLSKEHFRTENKLFETHETVSRKQAWTDESIQAPNEKLCNENQPKCIPKPSAVVPPYNADDDVETLSKGSLLEGNTSSEVSSNLSQWLENTNVPQNQQLMDPRRSVQLDFVPFLEERSSNSAVADPLLIIDSHSNLESLPIINGLVPSIMEDDAADELHESGDAAAYVPPVAGNETGAQRLGDTTVVMDCNGESQSLKSEGYFMFIDVGDVKPAENPFEDTAAVDGECTESPKRKPVEGFFFIPTDAVKSEGEGSVEPEAPPPAVEERLVPKAAAAPQPVYMYIEATSPTSSTNSGHSARNSKPSEKRGPILRRRIRGSAGAQRPKSESAATLLADATKILNMEKSSKRVSLAFGEEEDATYSIDESPNKDTPKEGLPPLPKKWCSKLGRDLLRMFLDEIDSDVVVRVEGKDIKAHKGVLTSRCIYFAAMLSGGWVENSGNVIKMQGFGYDTVHFALCHIYGGSTSVPDNVDIAELASLADMLGLEGLKEVVMLALKMKFCHFFHKPCPTCTTSVSECLLISTSFGLDELQEKCLKWITKCMIKAWPTKAFAALPDEILQKCYVTAKMEITADTVLDTLLRCDKLMATLPHVKWTEPVYSLTSRLAETASTYLAAHFSSVLESNSFLALRSGQSWSIHALETTFLLAIDRLPLDCACQAYVLLHGLLNNASQIQVLESADINENFDALLSKIHRQVEHFLIHNANRIVRCNTWALLSADLQKKIKDAAVIVFEFGKPTAPPPMLSSLNRKFTRTRASNSTSSASPTIERARTASSASHTTPRSSGQHKTADLKSPRENVKAATLPRAKETAVKPAARGSQQNAISEGAETSQRAVNRHAGSKTLPITKTCDIRKAAESNLNRRQSSPHQLLVSKNTKAGPAVSGGNPSVVNGSSANTRPKSWPAREKPIAPTVNKAKEKTPIKESPKDVRPATSTSVNLRSTARLSNGSVKTTPTAPRPKSAVYHNNNNRTVKQVCNGNVRDSKASNLRKAASSDLHGKENIDDIKPRSVPRPRSDDVSSFGSKRSGQRSASSRASRLTTSKP